MNARTSLWMIMLLSFEIDELLRNSKRDAWVRHTPERWSLQNWTGKPL